MGYFIFDVFFYSVIEFLYCFIVSYLWLTVILLHQLVSIRLVYLHAGFRQRLLDHMSLSCGEFEQSVLIITFKVQIVWISFSNGIRMLVHHPYNT